MDPAYADKKIIDLSEDELVALGYLGENVVPEIRRIVEQIRKDPEHLGNITCSIIDLFKEKDPPLAPHPPAISEAEILYSQLINDPEARTVVAPDLVSKYEMNFWYHGLSRNPPQLMWRSDIGTNPFPVPLPGTPFDKIPAKTAHGVFRTPLNEVWRDVAPRIIASLKDNGLKLTALHTTRFYTEFEDGRETRGPVVIWIAVRPNTTTSAAVRDATPNILGILAEFQITDVTVEWYEGEIVRLVDTAPTR